MTSTFVDIHVLQTVPPSNLNRDDTGSPKNAYYGGVQRARVSSQAWKRATRRDFEGSLDRSALALRTKRAVEQIAERIVRLRSDADPTSSNEDAMASARARAAELITLMGFSLEKGRAKKDSDSQEDNLTEYLTFFSNGQLDRFAEIAAAEGKLDKKELLAAAQSANGIEVSLFGRMVADNKELSVDAACQVAHAISTHAATVEHDYYTAVDDKAPADNAGAGMLGTVEFTSATLYRYATVALDQLERNLGARDAAYQATVAFIEAFVRSMPTGKQNTFANRTPVDAVIVQVRRGQPLNWVGAFEEPVVSDRGYVEPSARALAAYATSLQESYGGQLLGSYVVRITPKASAIDELGSLVSLDQLGTAVSSALAELDGRSHGDS